MEIYIRGLANISPQDTFSNEVFLDSPIEHSTQFILSKEPSYKEFIDPIQSRRMGRIIKMGIASAMVALKDAGVEMPDAIITGTGLGCLEDTEKFLTAMIKNNEQFLTPTSFIQSTHNTVSGQIALLLHCNNYNSTYVHRGFSFESTLMDAMMLLNEGEGKNILIGGIDEHNEHLFVIKQKLGLWKNPPFSNFSILNSTTQGPISGEGAAFFVISSEKTGSDYAQIKNLHTFYKPESEEIVLKNIQSALDEAGTKLDEIDVVVMGNSGDAPSDAIYHTLAGSLFKEKAQVAFKHLSGEYHTASSFGLWLGARILKEQKIPSITRLNDNHVENIKHVLFYNHYNNANHSVIVLSAC